MTTQTHSLEVAVPAEHAYRWWRGLTNLPSLLPDVLSVEMADNPQLTRWEVRDTAGATLQVMAKITEDIPNAKIAWLSADGAAAGLPESAVVRFTDNGETTHVEVTFEYAGRPARRVQHPRSVLTAFKRTIEATPAEHRQVERI
jgi:uncharacterized membrane protein